MQSRELQPLSFCRSQVCLGEEQERVARLRDRLQQLGEDPDVLLQGIGE